MSFETKMALLFSAGAVCTDLLYHKVPNNWIFLGFFTGLACKLGRFGIKGIFSFSEGMLIPFCLLFPLFLFRMMGAGDIKLLTVLGGFLGRAEILEGMFCIFLLGAVLSAAFLITCGNVAERFRYFCDYMAGFGAGNGITPYGKQGSCVENMHFTVPILLGLMLHAGGVY